jgi:uncharacterized protein (TIGR02118 family)
MYKALFFLTAKPGMSRQAFIDYYETTHWKFVRFVPGIRKYMRRYVSPMPGGPAPDFDVIMEMWFDDEASAQSAFAHLFDPERYKEVIADEENLFDRAKVALAAHVSVEEYESDLSQVRFDR